MDGSAPIAYITTLCGKGQYSEETDADTQRSMAMSKEVIIRLTSDHVKVKGGEYVRDLVRCGECKWKGRFGCPRRSNNPNDDNFCNFGEVRDE